MKEREAKGGAYCVRGRWFARVTVAPGKRTAEAMAWCNDEAAALARAQAIQILVNRLRASGQTDFIEKLIASAAAGDDAKVEALSRVVDGIVGGTVVKAEEPTSRPRGPTFKDFADRWTSGDLHREFPDHVPVKKTADDDELRLAKWIYPTLGDLPLADVTLDHAQAVLRQLPPELSTSTRRHVAQLMVRVLSLAVYPARLLPASPLPRGFLPKLGAGKAKAWLYPDEDATLLACTAVGQTEPNAPLVPLVHRLLYGVAHREGMRKDELERLTWGDLDLVRGSVRLDENKTDDPRTWSLDPSCAEALRRWREMLPKRGPTDLVFPGLWAPYRLAEVYREHLAAAGVDRPELFARSKSRRPIRFHDARASFITVALATGRSETWVADRTGHKSSVMINRYRRAARHAEELAVKWFAPLHVAIPELAAAKVAASQGCIPASSPASASPSDWNASEFPRMDSNHDKRNQNPLSCH